MNLLLDGGELPSADCVGQPLSQVLDTLASVLAEEGRVIVSVQVNDEPPEAECLAAPFDGESDAVVAVRSVGLKEHLIASLRESERLLPELALSVRELGSKFLRITDLDLREDFSECVSNLNDFFQFLAQLEASTPGPCANIPMGDATVASHNAAMRQLLEEVVSAFAAKDFVRMSDLMQYEVAPTLEAYAHIMPRMVSEIEAA